MSFLAPRNRYHQDPAKLDQSQYGGTIDQSAANAQNAYGKQQQVQGMLGQTAAGQGPNPAAEMLKQQTGQNVNMAAGQAASARGVNPALQARMAVDSASQANQQAAGQAATMQAQQSLAAQQAMMQNAQAMQQGQMGMYGAAGQLQNAQNQGNIANTLGAGQINAGVSAQNASTQAQMIGGILNSAGAIGGMAMGKPPGAASGGEITPGGVRRMAGGGVAGGEPAPLLYQYLDSLASMSQPRQAPQRFSGGGTAQVFNPYDAGQPFEMPAPSYEPGTVEAPEEPAPAAAPAAPSEEGKLDFGKPFEGDGGMGAYSMFAGMRTPGLALAGGGPVGSTFEEDGFVPGQAQVPGDDEQNDTVPALLSPGEVVIPRSIAQAPDAPQQAATFVSHLMRRKGQEGDGYSRVLQARGGGKQYADGGSVEGSTADYDPEGVDRALGAYAPENPANYAAAMQHYVMSMENHPLFAGARSAPQPPEAQGTPYDQSRWEQDEEGPVLHVDIGRRFAEGGMVPDENEKARIIAGLARVRARSPQTYGKVPAPVDVFSGKAWSPPKLAEGGEAPPPPPKTDDPGFVDAVKGWWAALGSVKEDPAREQVVEETSKHVVPEVGREGVRRQREKMKQIDNLFKD